MDNTDDAPGYSKAGQRDAVLRRLRRVEGQVRGVQAMVEDDRYCIDVLQQISAVQRALDKVALMLVDEHTRHCVMDASDPGQRQAELIQAIDRLVRRR